jgi:integrase/recombinase XerD
VAFDTYDLERGEVPTAQDSDFVLVNLFREPVGRPMPPGAVNELITAARRRAGLERRIRPHQLRHVVSA